MGPIRDALLGPTGPTCPGTSFARPTFVVHGANAGATQTASTCLSLRQATSGPLVATSWPHEGVAVTHTWRDPQVGA